MESSEIKYGILVMLGIVLLVFFTNGLDLATLKTFGKEKVEIKNEIREESTVYIQGMIEKLANYQYEYTMTDDSLEKKAIARKAHVEFANFDESKVTDANLLQFLQGIKSGTIH